MGPITPCSFKYGSKYIAVFVDDATQYLWAFSLGNKSLIHLAVGMLLKSIREIRGQNAKVKSFRLVNGTEYVTKNMKEVVKKEGIALFPVPSHTKFKWNSRTIKHGLTAENYMFINRF